MSDHPLRAVRIRQPGETVAKRPEQRRTTEDFYQLEVYCTNCDADDMDVNVPKGTPWPKDATTSPVPCPECGCDSLLRYEYEDEDEDEEEDENPTAAASENESRLEELRRMLERQLAASRSGPVVPPPLYGTSPFPHPMIPPPNHDTEQEQRRIAEVDHMYRPSFTTMGTVAGQPNRNGDVFTQGALQDAFNYGASPQLGHVSLAEALGVQSLAKGADPGVLAAMQSASTVPSGRQGG